MMPSDGAPGVSLTGKRRTTAHSSLTGRASSRMVPSTVERGGAVVG